MSKRTYDDVSPGEHKWQTAAGSSEDQSDKNVETKESAEESNHTEDGRSDPKKLRPQTVVIHREWKIERPTPIYYDPPEATILKIGQSLSGSFAVLTAVLWIIGEKPEAVQLEQVQLTEEEKRRLKEPELKDALTFIGMAGLMTVAKELRTDGNSAGYLVHHWTAVCRAPNVTNRFASGTWALETFVPLFLSFQAWIKVTHDLRRLIITKVLEGNFDRRHSELIRQVKLVWSYSGMKATQIMYEFIGSANAALTLEPVCVEAVAFKRAYERLHAAVGADRFPYAYLLGGAEVEDLRHRQYPNLYYAAVHAAREDGKLGPPGRFRISQFPTSVSKRLIEAMTTKVIRFRNSRN